MKQNRTTLNSLAAYKKRQTVIQIRLDGEEVSIPKKGCRYAVAYDIETPRDIIVPAHSRIAADTGFAINLPPGIEAKIEPRSGHSLRGLPGKPKDIYTYLNLLLFKIPLSVETRDRFDADIIVGKIDCGYKDNIRVIIKNNDTEFVIPKGTRIAQLTFYRYTDVEFEQA